VVLGLSAEIRLLEMRGRGYGQTSEGGVYACQCLSFAARLGRPVKESQGQNRTGENPPSGIAGGLAETSPLLGAVQRPIGKPMEIATGPYGGVRAALLSRPSCPTGLARIGKARSRSR